MFQNIQVIICPMCAKTPARITSAVSPNGGEFYIAEDMGDSTEYYDGVRENKSHTCLDCDATFYIGDTTQQEIDDASTGDETGEG